MRGWTGERPERAAITMREELNFHTIFVFFFSWPIAHTQRSSYLQVVSSHNSVCNAQGDFKMCAPALMHDGSRADPQWSRLRAASRGPFIVNESESLMRDGLEQIHGGAGYEYTSRVARTRGPFIGQ